MLASLPWIRRYVSVSQSPWIRRYVSVSQSPWIRRYVSVSQSPWIRRYVSVSQSPWIRRYVSVSQSPWIRRYVSVTYYYYLDELQWLVSGNHNIAHSSIFFRMQPGQRRPPLTVTLTLVTDLKLARVPRR